MAKDVTKEEVGANTETDKQFIYNTYTELLEDVEAKPGMTKTETYEEQAKALFTKEPANMKLLVVVDKLLTGFDAPPCTYLYIDKSMQDHGLFQAICRTNRLDGDDKDFGYIVDYKDLFKKVENAIAVYTSELDHSAGGADPEVLLQDRLKKGKERLDNALEAIALLVRAGGAAQGRAGAHPLLLRQHGDPGGPEGAGAATRRALQGDRGAGAGLCQHRRRTGHGRLHDADITRIKQQLDQYLNVREIIRKASGESLDLKAYEADMRHLIDTYIEADEPRKISPFDNMGLLDLIVKTGIANAIATQLGGLKGNKDAVAETIENNVRSKIIKEHLNDPAFYEKMSALLDEIIAARKAKAIEYEEYLKRIAELAKKVEAGQAEETPEELDTPGKRALYNNLGKNEELALRIDETVKQVTAGWLARRPGPRAGDQGGVVRRIAGRWPRWNGSSSSSRRRRNTDGARRSQLGEITVDVVLKDIKNVHLSVYPPAGRVRISAPSRMSLDTIRVFAISKLGWIKQQQQKLREQERETPREYLDRESHYVWGKRYLLKVVEIDEPPGVELKHSRMLLRMRPGAAQENVEAIVDAWYRKQIKEAAVTADCEMGAAPGREGAEALRAADEDQMGKLQSSVRKHPA